MLISVVNILLLFAIAFMVWRKQSDVLKPWYWPALILRICGGLFLGVLYNGYYTGGDTWVYFNDAMAVASLVREGWSDYLDFLWTGHHSSLPQLGEVPPRALFFTKLTSVAVLLSGGNYWLASCWFSLASFLSAWFLVREISSIKSSWRGPALFSFFFVPSVVCWSSGLIKESLAMSALCYIVIVFLRLWSAKRISIWYLITLLPALWLLWGLKYYYLAILLPVMVTEIIMQCLIRPRFAGLSRYADVLLWVVLFMIPVAIVSVLHPNFYPQRLLDVIVSNYEVFHAISEPHDVVHYPGMAAEPSSIILHAPKALVAALFRPFIWEASNVIQFLAAGENLVVLVLTFGFVIAVVKGRNPPGSSLALPLIMYFTLLGIFLALSTPNFGTLSRYRVGFEPFFILLITSRNSLLRWLTARLDRNNKALVG